MFRLLIVFMLVASVVRVASAEDYYASIYAGIIDVGFSESYGSNNTVSAGSSELFYGGAFGGYVNDEFSLELAVEQMQADINFGGSSSTGKVEATLAFINGYYHFNDTFYVGAGIGGGEVEFTVPTGAVATGLENTIDEKLPYQAIVGYKIALTDTIELDTRLRYLVIDTADITSISTGLRFNF